MEYATKKEVSDALLLISERLNGISESLAQLGAALNAVKAVLAGHMNPPNPKQALEHIQTLEENFAKLDPNAAGRKQMSEAIEMVKMIEKHGGPKQA